MSSTRSPWYEQFFAGLVLEFWRRITPPELTRAEADFLQEVLRAGPSSALLDVACGNGRHAVELAKRGCRVTGIDISEEFVEEARAAALAQGAPCEFVRCDMRRLERVEEFDGAYCMGNSFGYLAHEDTLDFLMRLSRALRPGALAAIDSGVVAEALLPDYRKRLEMTAGDMEMVAVNSYDVSLSRLQTDLVYRQGKRLETRSMTQHVYTAGELRRMVEAAGLRYVAAYGSVSGAKFQLGDKRYLLTAAKPG